MQRYTGLIAQFDVKSECDSIHAGKHPKKKHPMKTNLTRVCAAVRALEELLQTMLEMVCMPQ